VWCSGVTDRVAQHVQPVRTELESRQIGPQRSTLRPAQPIIITRPPTPARRTGLLGNCGDVSGGANIALPIANGLADLSSSIAATYPRLHILVQVALPKKAKTQLNVADYAPKDDFVGSNWTPQFAQNVSPCRTADLH